MGQFELEKMIRDLSARVKYIELFLEDMNFVPKAKENPPEVNPAGRNDLLSFAERES